MKTIEAQPIPPLRACPASGGMRRVHTSTALCQRNMLASEVTGRSRESAPVGGGRAYGKVGPGGGARGSSLLRVGWWARWDPTRDKGSDYSGTFVRISAGILMAPRRLGASHLDLVCAWPSATRSHAALKNWCQRVRLERGYRIWAGINPGLTTALACPSQDATTAQVNSIVAQSARRARAFSASTGPLRHRTSHSECVLCADRALTLGQNTLSSCEPKEGLSGLMCPPTSCPYI